MSVYYGIILDRHRVEGYPHHLLIAIGSVKELRKVFSHGDRPEGHLEKSEWRAELIETVLLQNTRSRAEETGGIYRLTKL
ncbi:MAG: hypothetical protein SF002_10455 [Alphaproteobacteria bacterium]|nr:hypothetical protein [Alphaproteobacteria bacterium]